MILPEYHATLFEATPGIAWPDEFAIVTAWHPLGQDTAEEVNAAYDEQLALRIDDLGRHKARVTGVSPDGEHREPGWAIWPCSEDEAVTLGQAFAQNAIYHVQHGTIFVVCCTESGSRRQREEVAPWQARLKTAEASGWSET